MKIRLLFLLPFFALLACNGSDDAATPTPQPVTPPEVEAPLPYFTTPERTGEVIESESQAFHVQTVVEGLMIPWSMAFLPDGVALITERRGTLRIVQDGELDPVPLDGVPGVFAEGQGGLLDVMLHPDYENNGWIYLTYADPDEEGAHTALMRAKLDLDGHRLVEQEELFSGVPRTNSTRHFGGRMVFRDGYVFVGTGDRGEMDEAQNLASHNGVVIRLHEDGAIPEDNPFVEDAGALPEIWSYGHRNIQGMTLHTASDVIWSHEHGPRGGDEINIIRRGLNYGWPEITHGVDYDGTPISDDTEREGMEQPVTYWTPSIAPSGMTFVSGEQYPQWEGNLLVGALAGQELRRVVLEGEDVADQETLLQGLGRIRDVRMAPDGYIYIADESSGMIVRLVPAE